VEDANLASWQPGISHLVTESEAIRVTQQANIPTVQAQPATAPSIPPAAPAPIIPTQPAAPAPAPKPAAAPRPASRKGVLANAPRGPILVAGGLLAVIVVLVLFLTMPATAAILVMVAAALVFALVWIARRQRRKAAARGGKGRPQMHGTPGGPVAAAAAQRRAGGLLAGLRSRLPGKLGGTRAPAGGGLPNSAGGSRTGGLGRIKSAAAKLGRKGSPAGPALAGARSGGLASAKPRSAAAKVKSMIPARLGGTRPAGGGKAAKAARSSRPSSAGGGLLGRLRPAGGGRPSKTGGAAGGNRTGSPAKGKGLNLNPFSMFKRSGKPAAAPAANSKPAGTPKVNVNKNSGQAPQQKKGDETMSIFRPNRPTRPAAGQATGNGGPQTVPANPGRQVGTGGGYGGGDSIQVRSRSHFEGMSFARYLRTMGEVADSIGGARRTVEAWAGAAAEDMPFNGDHVSSGLQGIAARMRGLEQEAMDLVRDANRKQEMDKTRWEAPRRGSHAVEQKADSRAAQMDS
jgi:type IV secretory pathway TrbD component